MVTPSMPNVKAPVLGFYAGNDMRINSTLPGTEAAMQKLGKSYEKHIFEGAGHGFMGGQAGAGILVSRRSGSRRRQLGDRLRQDLPPPNLHAAIPLGRLVCVTDRKSVV